MDETTSATTQLQPHFDDIQAHYDISDDFFGLFQDPSRTYSCAYFEPPGLSLEDAQVAKIDLNLDKLNLEPGMTLLDIGCGWGATMRRAVEKYDVNVIGLTLSKNQFAYTKRLLDGVDSPRTRELQLHGWEQFHRPVDRIVSIEAFEHFGFDRYDDFFTNCFDILPAGGRMVIRSSTGYHPYDLNRRGKALTFETARFIKFMVTEIFPGGRIPTADMMVEHGRKAGFEVPECLSLRPHYIQTLGIWADKLEARREQALAVTSEEVYQRYMRYLCGCRHYFSDEMLDVNLVTYVKPEA